MHLSASMRSQQIVKDKTGVFSVESVHVPGSIGSVWVSCALQTTDNEPKHLTYFVERFLGGLGGEGGVCGCGGGRMPLVDQTWGQHWGRIYDLG